MVIDSEIKLKTVSFPPSTSVSSPNTEVQCQTSIVVVGANGSGKSRLGSWLEFKGPQKDLVHRIAAQRSLVFPESSSPIGYESAQNAFHWAPMPSNWNRETYESNKQSLRLQQRYGGALEHAETAPVADFDKLLTLLFSENYGALLTHEEKQRKTNQLIPMPDTLIRKVQTLWEALLPTRSLQLRSGEVRVIQKSAPNIEYSARAMSDGERVVFYLIGQCLCARQDAIVVVDEPEIHLHKAIQDALWNSLEKARPDCTFVYLTHDLAFAVDRSGAAKICISSYLDGLFEWFAISDQQGIPEEVFLEVLGSRKPVLFVEGANGSHDVTLYRVAYPSFTVKPMGSCASVVAATKVFRSLIDMHHIESFGLVDRDYLEQGQIDAYRRAGIFVPDVAEVENLYLVPEILRAVADQLLLDQEKTLSNVMKFVFEDFERWLPMHAIETTQQKVSLMLGRFSSDHKEITAYACAFEAFQQRIDPHSVYNMALSEAQTALSARDYKTVLRLFNKKDLSKNLGRFFEITKGSYVEKVTEMNKRGVGDIPLHLRAYLPDIEGMLAANTQNGNTDPSAV